MKTLQLFLLAADRLVRCRWDGRSERLEVLNSALEGETLREVARDAADPRRLCAATLTEIHVSEDGGQSWRRLNGNLPAGHAHMTCGFAAHPEDFELFPAPAGKKTE